MCLPSYHFRIWTSLQYLFVTILHSLYEDQFKIFIWETFSLFICGQIYTAYVQYILQCKHVDTFTHIVCESVYTLYMWSSFQCSYVDQFTLFIFGLIYTFICEQIYTVYILLSLNLFYADQFTLCMCEPV